MFTRHLLQALADSISSIFLMLSVYNFLSLKTIIKYIKDIKNSEHLILIMILDQIKMDKWMKRI